MAVRWEAYTTLGALATAALVGVRVVDASVLPSATWVARGVVVFAAVGGHSVLGS